MERRPWNEEEEKQFEELYKDGKSFEYISKKLNRSIASLNRKSSSLELGKKYTRKNNPNYKREYQDYDWCYERFIVKGMSYEEMAKECDSKARTIQKWCSEKHKLNQWTYKREKHISSLQHDLMMFGLLGDGHIDKREHQPMYIESHAENQKDYLYWKYDILRDLCNKEPSYIKAREYNIMGTLCNVQAVYRLNTRILNDLFPIREMTKYEIVQNLTEFGLCIFTLDDGYRSTSNWELCVADFTYEAKELFLKIIKQRFGLDGHYKKDDRYIMISADSSRILDGMILENLPNDLDIVKYKILENNITNKANYYKILDLDKNIVGLNTFCRSNKIAYLKAKEYLDNKNTMEYDGTDLLDWWCNNEAI